MALNKATLTIAVIIISALAWGRTQMPELALKQQIKYSRFVSKNGKYTYYQNSSGKLFLSTNYSVKTIRKGPKNCDFQIVSSLTRKKIVILQNDYPHNFLGMRKEMKIFVGDFGKPALVEIGAGVSPQLHLDDSWISYYSHQRKSLIFNNLKNRAIKFKIKLVNKINPYYTPTALMLNEKKVIFTDINEQGIPGLIQFDRITQKTSLLLKADTYNNRLELCATDKNIYLGVFPLSKSVNPLIYEVPLTSPTFENPKIVYESSLPDIGNLLCTNDKIYFIKSVIDKNKRPRTELASLKNGEVKIVSDIGYVTNVISMDGNILIPYQANFYIVDGNTDLNKDNLK